MGEKAFSESPKTINIIFIVPYPQMEESIKQMIHDYLTENPGKPVRILYVIPYAEQDLGGDLEIDAHLQQKHGSYTHKILVDTQKQIDQFISPYIDKLDFEYDAIIARGNLADKLRESKPAVPTINIPFTGYDVIYSLLECKKDYRPKRAAIIGQHRVISHAKGLGELLKCDLGIYGIQNPQEVEPAVKRAIADGCDAVIGGYTTSTCAKSYGLNVTVFRTGPEAITMALAEAIRAVELVRKERERSETYRIITQSSQDGMIYVNTALSIRVINPAAQQMYSGRERVFQGRPLRDLFPYMVPSVERVLNNGKEIANELHQPGESTLSVNYLPVRVKGDVAGVVIHFQNVTKIQDTESQLRKKLSHKGLSAKYQLEDVIHKGKLMEHTLQTARRYAEVSSNILIVGETGTGKELIAQGIHNISKRKNGPFVAVNCAALTENLLESELFGYVEGAFTGANRGGKMGLFELAHNGTIFLDEISEIPLNFQSKLLRVLQEREIRRIGDDKVVPVDVRVIAATNRNLQKMAQKGLFRQDLLYRLNILRLYVPPLSKRREDIEVLFDKFLQEYGRSFGRDAISLSPEALQILTAYEFRGNVRELRNLAERICVLYSGGTVGKAEIQEALFPEDVEEGGPQPVSQPAAQRGYGKDPDLAERLFEQFRQMHDSIERELIERVSSDIRQTQQQMERELIQRTLAECAYNQSKAAKALGIDRSTLWRKLQKYKL